MGELGDFVMTIESDSEEPVQPVTTKKPSKTKVGQEEDALLDPDFTFDVSGDPYYDLLDTRNAPDTLAPGDKPVRALEPFHFL